MLDFAGLCGAKLPAHTASKADIGPGGLAPRGFPTFEFPGSPDPHAPNERARVVDIGGRPWVRFTHAPEHGLRTEVAGWPDYLTFLHNTEKFHHISFIPRQGPLGIGEGAAIAQLHQTLPDGSNIGPPMHISFDRKNEGLRLLVTCRRGPSINEFYTNKLVLWQGTSMPVNRRFDVKWKTVYSTDETKGSMRVWVRSTAVGDVSNYDIPWTDLGFFKNNSGGNTIRTLTHQHGRPYPKQGIYRWRLSGGIWVIDHDFYVIGDSDADVMSVVPRVATTPTQTTEERLTSLERRVAALEQA